MADRWPIWSSSRSRGWRSSGCEELRLGAVEERIEAELAVGRHAAACAELETLVEEHPLRERLRGQLMLALYRSGRQADALEIYRAGRSLLVDELGLEPGPELQELERAILTHDPELQLATSDPGPRPRAVPRASDPHPRSRAAPRASDPGPRSGAGTRSPAATGAKAVRSP